MVTVTIKVTKRQVLGAAAVFLLAFAAGVWGKAALARLSGGNAPDTDSVVETAAADVVIHKANAKTEEQRLELLNRLGWEVEPEPAEVLEIAIPGKFDDVLMEYNAIQIQQDCDLMRYRGKNCTRYTYVITNHPSGDAYVRANLLVFKDKIIGGDVSSLRQDGFMSTLRGEEVNIHETAGGGAS